MPRNKRYTDAKKLYKSHKRKLKGIEKDLKKNAGVSFKRMHLEKMYQVRKDAMNRAKRIMENV